MFTFRQTARPQMLPTPGRRATSRLLNAVQSHFLTITMRATLNITAAATAVRNRGSLAAAFTLGGILEGGTQTWTADPRGLRFLSEASAPSSLAAVRVDSAAVGVTELVEQFRIYFAHPFAAKPGETGYMEHNVGLDLAAFFDMAQDPISRLLDLGAGAATLTNVTIDVEQEADETDAVLPLLRPTCRRLVLPVNGAASALPLLLQAQHRQRAILISQYNSVDGEVNDVVNGLTLGGDRKFVIGPEVVDFQRLARAQEQEYGGDVYAGPQGSHLLFTYQKAGRLSNLLNPPLQDTNMRFQFDVQPGAGAGDDYIDVTLFELEADGFSDPVTGRRVTAGALPFAG